MKKKLSLIILIVLAGASGSTPVSNGQTEGSHAINPSFDISSGSVNTRGKTQFQPSNAERRFMPDPAMFNTADDLLSTFTIRTRAIRNLDATMLTALRQELSQTWEVVIDSSGETQVLAGSVLADASDTSFSTLSTGNDSAIDARAQMLTYDSSDSPRAVRLAFKFGVVRAGRFKLHIGSGSAAASPSSTPTPPPTPTPQGNQTITFGALTNKTFGDPDFNVSATASSGLTVSFTATGSCTIAGNTVHLTGAGSCTITASQAGNANFNAAPNVPQSFTISKGNQTIAFGALADKTFGDADFNLSATASSGLTVSFSAGGSCIVTANTIHLTGAGSCTVSASQSGNANFNPSPSVPRSFPIAKAATTTSLTSALNPSALGQSVTFTATVNPAPNTATPTGTVQFKDGGVNLGAPVSLNPSGVAQLTTSTLTVGTHAITSEYSGNTNFDPSTGSLSQVVNSRVLLKFNQSNYSVNENGKIITITVIRSGDTTPVTVDYASPDDSAAMIFLPCSTIGGIASPRCDFTTAIGTLRFASGETSKTFDVLISQDTYLEGPETFTLTLTNPTGGAGFAQPSDANAIVTIDDDDSGNIVGELSVIESNPIDDHQNFVRQHYHDFLNREPDEPGLNFWTSQITNCGVNQACIDAARVSVSASFFLSIEFQQTGYYVERIYKTGFGDIAPPTVPVPIRFIDFLRDTQEVGRGVVVGQGPWEAQLDANKRAFALAFVQRPDFLTRYPASTSAQGFVSALNANAGTVLTPAEQLALVTSLSTNPADAMLRANVLFQIAENQTLQQQEFNRAFVLMQYFGYLRRNPDAAPDADFAGFNFWLTKLNQFNGDFIKAEMVKAFLTSTEYRQRFGP